MDCSQIQFCANKEKVDLIQVREVLNIGTFWARDRQIEDLEIAIANSDPVITVWDGSRIIGFARATSDVIYRAGIWDVVIHPEYRGSGLGRKLVETVLAHPRVNRVEKVYLTTTHQQSFYERIGFVPMPSQSTTMILDNKAYATATNSLTIIGRSPQQTQEESNIAIA
jgi:ribosomal protein S18 acetylase RimI-like enzyme